MIDSRVHQIVASLDLLAESLVELLFTSTNILGYVPFKEVENILVGSLCWKMKNTSFLSPLPIAIFQ